MNDPLQAYLADARSRQLAELMDWLRIPSISALPAHREDVHRAATWLADHLRQIGLEHVSVIPSDTHPLVRADWLHAGPDKPTVLIYGHFDVQPVDPLEEWETPPFEPTIKAGPHGEDLYARGASDDKGQIFIHVKAVEALLATTGRLPVNVKFIVEGEEEYGGRTIQEYVTRHVDELAADVALISDSHMLTPNQPAILYGLRGMWSAQVTVTGPAHDLHSGSYGGAIHNANQALCELLAALHDRHGHITVPGFYEQVRDLSPEERAALAQVPYGEAEILAETGAPALYGEPEFTVVERIGARPTLEINGMWGGFTGDGFKTVIPAQAHAKISCRLVPHQDPDRIEALVTDYLKRLAPPTIQVEVRTYHKYQPFLTPPDLPAMRAAARACRRTFGTDPVFMLEGGGIPIVSVFQEELQLPVVLLGFGLPDDNLHAPNEKFHLPNFYRGIATSIALLEELAAA
ncbi:dipeptidase [Litorilinea aerophila]|uniref:Dipeptidase n=1 Tax=Litorilinea aerophila TaxID=1204385 RepID=A0A540VL11_9CHLR|nr:dipeptidase [Litorilinea aerophila]MCC9075144.1 dipeptidase [Litorilinea aerophila]